LDYFRFCCQKTTKSVLSDPPAGGESKDPLDNGEGNFLTIIDESHVTLPQIRGMYEGDKSRKNVLVEHGFRLPSAKDNRPLKYTEFEAKVNQLIYMSATPAQEELEKSEQIVEQIVRPTGLIDPKITIRPVSEKRHSERSDGISTERSHQSARHSSSLLRDDVKTKSQIEDLIERIDERIKIKEKVLVTTLTKRMAEDLTEYLEQKKIKVKYLHSDVETLERIEVLTALRQGKIDVIVGVNLLREGLDLPEVSLVAILDADKEGFLRNDVSLIQTIGRAARNVNGEVILYADKITESIKRAVSETDRRRKIQIAYNKKHNITPKTIEKNIKNILEEFGITPKKSGTLSRKQRRQGEILKLDLTGDKRPMEEIIKDKESQMKRAAKELEFELAAILRDEIYQLRKENRK
jgi:excinuclease ABC subunit B